MLRTFAEWAELPDHSALQGETIPLYVGETLAAIGLLDGTEIHFASAPDWRGRLITRRRLREYLGPLLERRGYLTTRAMQDDARNTFVQRLGFELTHTTNGICHYMLCSIPFDKEN